MSALGTFEASVSERTPEGLAFVEIWSGCGTILRRSVGKLCLSYGDAVELARLINEGRSPAGEILGYKIGCDVYHPADVAIIRVGK